jgi:hypothetical protein
MTPAQCRAARALINMPISRLAGLAVLPREGLKEGRDD